MLLIGYSKCSTCLKAIKILKDLNYQIEYRDIKKANPSLEEIKNFHQLSKLKIDQLFNSSGLAYKALNLKDQLKKLSDEEKYQLLASDGMLIKRPIIILDHQVYFGFKKELWIK